MVGRAESQTPTPLAGDGLNESQWQMEARGNREPDPPDAQTAGRQRPHSLEHEKPDAQWRFGRGARTGSLRSTFAHPGFALAGQAAAAEANHKRRDGGTRGSTKNLLDIRRGWGRAAMALADADRQRVDNRNPTRDQNVAHLEQLAARGHRHFCGGFQWQPEPNCKRGANPQMRSDREETGRCSRLTKSKLILEGL